ncbi:hypothetical protein Tco_0907564 [Tanacetum coccineum]|uniref:Uncharacterized protein n=1 Tax=Tanacetum coccineum TaxID=301880 RepID=A0ABQ5CKQ3_9ASTR
MPITTAKEKAQRRLEVKARSTLMIGIPNEHQLKFNSIKDAKKLMEAVEKRFGGNEATKKTQRNLLKQQYENFTAPISEMLDQTFDRLQKLMSQLELLGEKISQEDVNQQLLRSLSYEWNTHAVVWRNKADLDTMSMDALYNNLKVQPNSPQLVHEDLQQIHPDDMEEIDLRWQIAMLTMRARSPKWSATTVTRGDILLGSAELQEIKTTRTRNAQEGVCMWKHLLPHLLVSCDGLGGYDWSDQAKKGPNYALMAFSSSSPDSEGSNDSICLKSCLKTIESLKSQNDQLLKDLKKSELIVLGYKTGLKSVEEKHEVYKSNESIYLQDIKGLKFEIYMGEIAIRELRKKLDIVQKEKDGIQLNVDKFDHASKSLNKLIESQIVDNCKKGLGYENYNAVPPPYT